MSAAADSANPQPEELRTVEELWRNCESQALPLRSTDAAAAATAPEVTVCVAGFTDPRFWPSGRVPPIDKITKRPAAAAAAAPKSAADQNGEKIAQIAAIANLAHQLPNVYTSARVASELANIEALFAED